MPLPHNQKPMDPRFPNRSKVLIDRGLSHGQARKLCFELSDRGVGVECTPSRTAGWDVWAYAASPNEHTEIAADD